MLLDHLFYFVSAVLFYAKHTKKKKVEKGSVSSVFRLTLYGISCVILFSDYRGYADYNHARVGARWELILILIP